MNGGASSPIDEAAIPPFRLPGLFLMCFLAVGFAWMLKPVDSELVSRLIADGDLDRAQELIGADSRSGLIDFLIAKHATAPNSGVIGEIIILAGSTDDPAAVLQLLGSRAYELTPTGLVQCLESLAKRCLQLERPDLACQAFEAIAKNTALTDRQLLLAVEAGRFCGEPERAYAFISENCQRRDIELAELSPNMLEITLQLLRETNRNDIAYEILARAYPVASSMAAQKRTLEKLIEAATLAGRSAETTPFLRDFVSKTDPGKLSWAELVQRRNARQSDAEFLEYGPILARHCEWQAETNEAFDLYRKLAFLGDAASLDRCVEMYRWQERGHDLADLLGALDPNVLKPDQQLLLARLEAGFGDMELAEKRLRAVLAGDYQEKAMVWEELGHLLSTAFNRFHEAQTAYLHAIELDPALTDSRIRVALMYIATGQYGEALELYRTLPESIHTYETLENFLQLAKSLDSYPDLIRATRIRMTLANKPHPNDFTDIAYYHTLEGNPDQAEAVLREGLSAFPGNPDIGVFLIDFLIRSDRMDDSFGVAVAAYQGAGDLRFITRLIYTGISTGNSKAALQALDLIDPLASSWQPLVRLRLADLYEHAGDLDHALAVYQSVPQGEVEFLRLRAAKAFDSGDYPLALEMQQRYMREVKSPDFQSWMFTGEIYLALGQVQLSQQANDEALRALKTKIRSRPPSRPPTDGAGRQ